MNTLRRRDSDQFESCFRTNIRPETVLAVVPSAIGKKPAVFHIVPSFDVSIAMQHSIQTL